MPVAYTPGAFVPNMGWFLFGGNPNFTQSQYLQSIDGAWAIGDPFFGYDSDLCSVQVKSEIKTVLRNFYIRNSLLSERNYVQPL